MKLNYKNIFVAILLACFTVSCDLDTTPTNAMETKAVFKDTKNAESVLRGAWRYIFNSGNTYASIGIGTNMLNDDFAGSDVVRTLSYGFSGSYQMTNGYGRGEYNSVLWNLMYTPINNCNNIIKYIDDVSGTNEDKERIKGQAYATRGYLYMYLASHYSFAIDKDPNAVCVPIYTEPTDVDVAKTGNPAASVSEVYKQALDDLGEALKLIPESYSRGSEATKQYMPDHLVTLGLLARTNLYARNWKEAYDNAVEALALNNYLMTEDEYKSGFSDCTNKEWMWAYSGTLDDSDACYLFHFKDCTSPESYYTSVNVDPWFKAMFEDGDYRKDLFNWGQTAYLNWALLNSKFKFKDAKNELGDIVLMRSSEMYLIKAEAAARIAGKETEAQQILQTIRNARMKSGTATPVTATGDDLIKEIWKERRKELWAEGFSLTDIIRNQQSVERKEYTEKIIVDGEEITVNGHTRLTFPDGSAFEPNSKYYLFRIPETEELQNKNLYSKYPRLSIYDQK
ncbi:MAG: RagB/SusD family nutrient uptake outer membrane protein [Dysgonomonas sp.]|nr:RagB/SusD family nutrient uptake outer membrane protein [Dysgonomonas sp.]